MRQPLQDTKRVCRVHELPADHRTRRDQFECDEEQFTANVEKAKEYIRAGDIFQVVLSQRFEIETEVSPLHVYRVLRTMNPSPYMYVLKLCDEMIVGASPELLVRVEGDRVRRGRLPARGQEVHAGRRGRLAGTGTARR